jgi:hypothetical protein
MMKQKYWQLFRYASTIVPATLSKVKLCTGGNPPQQNLFDKDAEMLCGCGFAVFS